jgi:hypothetical protein
LRRRFAVREPEAIRSPSLDIQPNSGVQIARLFSDVREPESSEGSQTRERRLGEEFRRVAGIRPMPSLRGLIKETTLCAIW